MKAIIVLILLFGLHLSAQDSVAQSTENNAETTNDVNKLGRKFVNAVKNKNDDTIIEISDLFYENDIASQLSPQFAGFFFQNASRAYWRKDNLEKALIAATNLANLDNDDQDDPFYNAVGHFLSFHLNRESKNYQETFESLDAFLTHTKDPKANEAVSSLYIESKFIGYFLRELKPTDNTTFHPLKVKTYETLLRHKYMPEDPFRGIDYWRLEYANHLISVGDKNAARRVIKNIENPHTLMNVYMDRKFEDYWNLSNLKSVETIQKTFENEVPRLKSLIEKNPKNLWGRISLMQALINTEKYDEAKSIGESALKDAESFDSFDDRDDNLNWLLNEMATLSYLEGDTDTGNNFMNRAAFREEVRGANISQVINYTEKLLAQGKYQKALEYQNKYIEPDKASDYGRMWVWFNQACISHLLNDEGASKKALAKLRKNPEHNYAAYTSALICLNDIDGAANSYIARLNNLEHRPGALEALQKYKPSPSELPFEKTMRERWMKVTNNPELQRTVKKYGRIADWPITNTYWGNY